MTELTYFVGHLKKIGMYPKKTSYKLQFVDLFRNQNTQQS